MKTKSETLSYNILLSQAMYFLFELHKRVIELHYVIEVSKCENDRYEMKLLMEPP